MDILRTSLQEQSDQMLQEQEARMQRAHSKAIKTLNDRHQEELRVQNRRVLDLKKTVAELEKKSSELVDHYSKFEEVRVQYPYYLDSS